MKNKSFCNKNYGFTLIECLVVVAIIAFFTIFAINNFDFFKKNSAQSYIFSLKNAIFYARDYAVIHNSDLIIYPVLSFDDNFCTDNKKWKKIIIFKASYYKDKIDPDKIVLKLPEIYDSSYLLIKSSGKNTNYLRITNDGFGAFNATIFYCKAYQTGFKAKTGIIINQKLRLRDAKDSNHDGIVENSSHKDLNCL